MASLTEQVIINKLTDDLTDAIKLVGGDVTNTSNILQYPDLIKEQLRAVNVGLGGDIIMEEHSIIIKADSNGCNYYDTGYSKGVKEGLKPNVLYLRLCLAVNDSIPVYIDLTKITDGYSIEEFFIEHLTEEDINSIIKNK